jgi:hypothetical protein
MFEINVLGGVEDAGLEEVEDDLSASLLQPKLKTMMRKTENRKK